VPRHQQGRRIVRRPQRTRNHRPRSRAYRGIAARTHFRARHRGKGSHADPAGQRPCRSRPTSARSSRSRRASPMP
jgi:hypothetical protein